MTNFQAESYQEVNFKKIPSLPLPDDSVPELCRKEDEFVDVEAYSGGKIQCRPAYYLQGIKGAMDKCLMRREVADRLLRARARLPEGWTFQIFDAWRPYDVQYSLYSEYFCGLARKAEYQELTVRQLHKIARRFVSYPEKGKELSYVHSSGGAVDLTLVDGQGNEVDMGSVFDEFSDRSHSDYYEQQGMNEACRANRRLLYQVMHAEGFTNLPSEWWHYDYGDRFWAYYTGEKALYASVYEIPGYLRERVRVHG